jgi:hypothetical protein
LLAYQTATATAAGISPVGTGTHQVEASYSGDASHATSLSPTTPLTAQGQFVMVLPFTSTITTAQSLPVVVSVSAENGQPTPTGTVTLTSGNYTSSPTVLNGGTATILVADGLLPAGTDSLTAIYTPDAQSSAFYPSGMGTALISVIPLPPSTTTLSIATAGMEVSSVVAGTPVQLIASVQSNGAAVTTGTVNFCDASAASCTGTHLLGTAQLTGAGAASIALVPGIGSHSYKAVFTGITAATAPSTPSSATASLLVTGSLLPTATSIASGGNVGDYTLTASVVGIGNAAPGGTVSFLDTTDNNAVLGTANLSASGIGFSIPVNAISLQGGNAGVVGDFNGDGIPDLAISNYGYLNVYLGKGDGTFYLPPIGPSGMAGYVYTGVSDSQNAVVTGDFDGDGILDLAVVNHNSGTITILHGLGDGNFTPLSANPVVGSDPQALVVGDFNGDGILDLAVANSGSNTVTVLLGKGDGTFKTASSPATGAWPISIVTGDFNGDGIADLAVANAGNASTSVTILLGDGRGNFAPSATSLPVPCSYIQYPASLVVGDFNGDGILDLALPSGCNNGVAVLLGKGDGTFAAETSPASGISATYSDPDILATGDFNGDGIPDLAVVNFCDGNQLCNQGTATILLGDGTGRFAVAANPIVLSNARYILSADLNGDGVSDLIVGSYPGNSVLLAYQTATATAAGISPVGTGTHQVEASYSGDASHATSLSPTTPLTAQLPPPTMTLTASASNVGVGTQVTFTADLSTSSVSSNIRKSSLASVRAMSAHAMVTSVSVPTGTVTFMNGSAVLGASPLVNGVATFATSQLPIGTNNITSMYSGDSNFPPAASSAVVVTVTATKLTPTVLVSPSSPSITMIQPLTVTIAVNGGTGSPLATGSVTLTSGNYISAATALANGSATIIVPAGSLAAGDTTLTVNYAPDSSSSSTYNNAVGSVGVTVSLAIPSVSWSTPNPIAYGTSLSATQLNASASVAGSFVYTPSSGTVPSAGTQVLSVAFTPSDAADYSPASQSVSLLVSSAPLTVKASSPSVTYGSAIPVITPSYSGFVNGDGAAVVITTPTCATSYTTATAVNAPPPTTSCSGGAFSSNYMPNYVNGAVTILQATPTIAIANLQSVAVYGGGFAPSFFYIGDGAASVTSLTTGICSVSGGVVSFRGVGTCTLTPSATAGINFAATSGAAQSLAVGKATPTIAIANIPAGAVFDGSFTPILAYNGDGVTSIVSNNTGICTVSGGVVSFRNVGICSLTASATAGADYASVSGAAQSFNIGPTAPAVIWPTPAPLVYGKALSPVQLNATANVVGTFVYTPAAGTVLSAGPQTLSVTFTPTDATQYSAVTKTVTLTVEAAILTVTAKNAAMTYGGNLPAFTYGITGFVHGDTAASAVTGAPELTPQATAQSPAGTYPINASAGTLDAANYTFAFNSGVLTISQAKLTVAATNASMAYGSVAPPLTYTFSGLVNGDTAASIDGSPVLSTTATANSPVGSYPISIALGTLLSGNYQFVFKNATLTVTKAVPMLTWAAPAAISFGTPLGNSQLDATASVAGSLVYSPASGTVLNSGTHTLSVAFTPADIADYTTAKASVSLTVNPASQTIYFAPLPVSVVFGGAPLALVATSSSGLAVNFSVVSGPAKASGSTLTITGAGSVVVAANQAGNSNYFAAQPVTQTVVVNPETPTLTWTAPAAITYGVALGSKELDAKASVAGVLSYTPAAGTVLKAGTQTLSVTFTPADTVDYTTATATVTLTVNPATPAINWPAPANIVYGTPLSTTQLDASSSVEGVFTYTPAAGSVLSAGTQTLNATFTPTDAVDYTTASKTVTFTVKQAVPTVTWSAPAATVYGTPLSTTQLDASTSVEGVFTYNPAAGSVLSAGAQTLSVTFTPSDTADYTTVTKNVSISVTKAVPAIDWATPIATVYGAPLDATELNASSPVAGTFVYNPVAATVLSAGSHTLSVSFTPSDSADYTTAKATVILTVNPAAQAITFNSVSTPVVYGGKYIALSASSTSGLAVSFAVVSGPGKLSGSTLTITGGGSVVVSASQAGNANYAAAPTVQQTIVVNRAVPTVSLTSTAVSAI